MTGLGTERKFIHHAPLTASAEQLPYHRRRLSALRKATVAADRAAYPFIA
ncbi:MAG: hypothetical protein HZA63_15155 [Rhodocyclales bacterium]|nr:hypothetical protein [Rhodocyclales bacterium]